MTKIMAQHLSVPTPNVRFDLTGRMPKTAAGQFNLATKEILLCHLYVARPVVLAAVLAHELSHVYLFHHGAYPQSGVNWEDCEKLTDLAAVATGLGKALLNGTVFEVPGFGLQQHKLGYLPPEVIAHAYLRVCQKKQLPVEKHTSHLSPAALRLVNAWVHP